MAPFAASRIHIEFEKAIPMRFGDIAAGQPVEADAFFRHSLALFAQILALVGRQFTQELREIAIALIAPMKLRIVAQEIARLACRFPLRLLQEGYMERGRTDLFGRRLAGFQEQGAVHSLAGQKTRSCDRGERNRRLQLGVVIAARALQRIGPGVIEDIFALGMAFQVSRQDSRYPTILFQYQMRWPPAGARGGGAGGFQRFEEFIARERVR